MSEFKHIVRIKGKDLDGSKKLIAALADLKGVGLNLAYAIVNALRLDPKMRLGALSDIEINEIEKGLSDPSRIGIPSWKLNRRKSLDTGLNYHLIGADL
ncbi:MAG: 30S ribosomal protein S13, partial [Nitrososphaerales archaeon]